MCLGKNAIRSSSFDSEPYWEVGGRGSGHALLVPRGNTCRTSMGLTLSFASEVQTCIQRCLWV